MPGIKGLWSAKKAALQEMWTEFTGEPVDPTWTCAELREYLKEWAKKQASEPAEAEELKGLSSANKAELRSRGEKLGLTFSQHATRGKMMIDIKAAILEQGPTTGKTKMNFGVHRLKSHSEVWITQRQYCEWVIEEKETMSEKDTCSPQFNRFYGWLKSANGDDKMTWKPEDTYRDYLAKKEAIEKTDHKVKSEGGSSSSGRDDAKLASVLGSLMAEVKNLSEQVKEIKAEKQKGAGTNSEDSEGWARAGSPKTPAR